MAEFSFCEDSQNFGSYCLKNFTVETACKDDSGYITQLKQQKSKKVILFVSTLTICGDVLLSNITF